MNMKAYFTIIMLAVLIPSISFAQESNNANTPITPVKMKSVIIGIDGMACQEGCADKIAENLKHTAGVKSVEVSFIEKEAVIDYNPSVIALTDLKYIITNTKVKQYVYTINSVTLKE